MTYSYQGICIFVKTLSSATSQAPYIIIIIIINRSNPRPPKLLFSTSVLSLSLNFSLIVLKILQLFDVPY